MTKYITCPKCGEKIPVAVGAVGRNKLDLPFIFICETLEVSSTMKEAANLAKCSVGYIYKVCKEHGTSPKEVMGKRR